MIIGTFKQTKTGFTGKIYTLTLNAEVEFRPAGGSQTSEKVRPDFRIFSGVTELGAAWSRQARDTGRSYLSLKLDDPSFPAPIFASLHKADDGSFNLIWS